MITPKTCQFILSGSRAAIGLFWGKKNAPGEVPGAFLKV
jgi:hypothetical protein